MIEISCVEVWREISSYLEGDIDPALRARMEAHFQGCAHCTAVLDGTRNIVRLVGDGQAFQVPAGFGQRLYAKVRAYASQPRGPRPPRKARNRGRRNKK